MIEFYRATRVNRRAQNRTNTMTADEVITRLKDRMSQHKVQIRQAFLSFDKSGKGRVTKKNFREVRFWSTKNYSNLDIHVYVLPSLWVSVFLTR